MQYKGETPLAPFLKDYFKKDSKFGSRDRKTISSLCFAYFRAGKAFSDIEIKDAILYSYFLCSFHNNELLSDLENVWSEYAVKTIEEKIEFLHAKGISISLKNIFPCSDHLGDELRNTYDGFILSHLFQPDLFLRVRPGKQNIVEDILTKNNVHYERIGNAFRLANGTDISSFLKMDEDVVVQDLSSQKTGFIFSKAFSILQSKGIKPVFWDCCAASGGKSIMAFDLNSDTDITVSDIRKSIINNLLDRFARAGIKNFNYFIKDLTSPLPKYAEFNIVVADVPCSGSGTWSRTPEEMFFFHENKLAAYADKQRTILKNLVSSLSPGCVLIYITCSVYKDENEMMTEYISENSDFKLVEQQYFKGYNLKADTLFAALFISNA